MRVNITQEEYREWLGAMSDDRLIEEFGKCTNATSSDGRRAEASARELLTDVYCREADSDESAEKWQRAEKTAGDVMDSRYDLERSRDRLIDTAHEMNRRGLDYGRDTLNTAMNENYQQYRQTSQVIERSLDKFDDARERRESEGDSWKKDKNTNEEYRKSLTGLSNNDLVDEFKRCRDTALDRDIATGEAARLAGGLFQEKEAAFRDEGYHRRGMAGEVGQRLDHSSSVITEMDRQTERDYDRLRSTVDEMKNRDDLTFRGRDRQETQAQFEEIRDRGIQRSTDTKGRIDEFREVKGRIDESREQFKDISASRDQTDDRLERDDRRPNLTQSDPDRGQKRDDAEFLGREAAHVLPQGERDRQRDAARLRNPEEERGLEQELKPEMSLGGASSEPKAAQAKGEEREKTEAAGKEKEQAKEKAEPKGEQKAPEQKSALRRMMDRIKQQQAEQPKPAEEQSRRM